MNSTGESGVVSVAVEGIVDLAVASRLLSHVGRTTGPAYVKGGKSPLMRKLRGYNSAARVASWFVLVDLNSDEECAPPFVQRHLPTPAANMVFRVAVRQAETWLMGDRARLARFLQISEARVPIDPEAEPNAKRAMVSLARRSSDPLVRADMVPRAESGRSIGAAYPGRLIEFADRHWRPDVAELRVDSLRRCIRALREL